MASNLITGTNQVSYSGLQPRVTHVMDPLLPLFPQIRTETMIARSVQPQTMVLPPSPGRSSPLKISIARMFVSRLERFASSWGVGGGIGLTNTIYIQL